jgi:putative transposase
LIFPHLPASIAFQRRSAVYEVARANHPLRWKGVTRNWQRIDIVHLNPDQTDTKGDLTSTYQTP